MKIGIISDIHSNIYGLRAVLKELKKTDFIICAGDIVGYYTFVNEVFEEIKKNNIQTILGNHDGYLLGMIPESQNPITRLPLDFTKKNILPENIAYLEKIKNAKIELDIDGLKIKMYHGSPWQEFEDYVYPDSDFAKFENIGADLVILGHTHWPVIKKIGRTLVVNPGSCGQPRDYDSRSSYGIFDTRTKEATIERVPYEIDEVCKAAEDQGFDKKLCQILKRKK